MSDPTAFDALLRDTPALTLLQRFRTHRAEHWERLVRVVLCVTPADLDAAGAVRWNELALHDLDAPVTRDALRAWLATRPPAPALGMLSALFDPRDPRELTWADLIDAARAVYPEALVSLVPAPQADPFDAPRAARAGVDLADALAAHLRAHPAASCATYLRWADDATRARYLDLAAGLLPTHDVTEVGRLLAASRAVTDATRAAYAKALAPVVAALPKREAGYLYAYSGLLDAEALAALFQGPAKHVAVPERLMALTASQGFAHGADALAATLDHKKLGAHAALCLAAMGPVGVAAARRRLDAKAVRSDAGRSLAAALTALPAPPTSLWDGEWYGFPRFGRSWRDDLLPPATWPATPAHPPTPVEALEAAVKEKPARELLPATGWADLLQLVAIDPSLVDVRGAWAVAQRLGRLGHGDDRDALVAALDAVAWTSYFTAHHPVSDGGAGQVLLWAGCDAAVFRHAVARHMACGAGSWVGSSARHFERPLKDEAPPWAPEMLALVWFYNASIQADSWQGEPRLLASLDAPAPRAALAPPGTNLWVHATVEGAERVTLRLRGSVEVSVDLRAQRWAVKAPKGAEGATPPLDRGRPLRLAIETARDGMYVGVDGAMVNGPFGKLPMTVAPVEVAAEGDGARVTSLTLHEKSTVREAEAVGALLASPDAAQGYAEVAGQRSPAAAHLLATIARLGHEARATLARDALAAMKGAGLGPWQDAPYEAAAKPAEGTPAAPAAELPMTFGVRSFEDVVRAFEAMRLTGKSRGKKPPALHRGPTRTGRFEFASFNPKGAEEDWGARTAVPWPAVYLGAEEPDFKELRYFVEQVAELPALCRKGRGTWARGEHYAAPGQFAVAALCVFPDDGGYDEGSLFEVSAAAWRVAEGWAWAVTGTTLDDLARLVGVRAFPPQVDWAKFDRVVVGDW